MALNGIDISSHQKTLRPSQVDADFIIIKSTQGTTYINQYYKQHYEQAKKAGKLLGLYHYIDGSGAKAQAKFFVDSVIAVNGIGEAILAGDQQSYQNSKWGDANYVKTFMDEVYNLTGVKPFLYTSHGYCADYNNCSNYPLWGAQYANYNITYYQSSPWEDGKPWGNWGDKPTIRQYQGEGGRVKGYSGAVDLNLFYGTRDDWKKWATPANKNNSTSKPTQTQTSTPTSSIDFNQYFNKISNSGGDQNWGISGGYAGDQTSHEWEIKNWYSYPWNCVLRYPDQKARDLIAELAIQAANNNNIGYDQWERNSYWTNLQKVGYYPSRITTPCEADCSAGVIANTKAVGYLLNIQALKNITATYTGNMREDYRRAGFQILTDSKYLTSSNYLMPGDILLNDVNHVATNLGIGSNSGYNATKPATTTPTSPKKTVDQLAQEVLDGKWGNGDDRKQALTNAGYDYNAVQAKVNQILSGSSSPAPIKTIPMYTNGMYSKTVARNGKIVANLLNIRLQPTMRAGNLTSYPTLPYGTIVGICMETKDEDGDSWYYIKINGRKGEKYGFASASYIEVI